VAAAALIGIGLGTFLHQAIGLDGPGIFFLTLGIGFYLAYINQRRPSDLIVPAGVLSGLGLGITLGSASLIPQFLHAALCFGSFALGFAAIYLLGEPKHRWAMWPATGLGLVAWLAFVTSAPWLKEPFGALAPVFWPLLLVAAGFLIIERGRHGDRSTN
jgi:hypothetical protein